MSRDEAPADPDGLDHQDRIGDLEARYAFLDDQVQHLDAIVVAQRDLIDRLAEELRRVRESLETMRPDMPDGGPEPPPPHY